MSDSGSTQRRWVVAAASHGAGLGVAMTDWDRPAVPAQRLGFLIGDWDGTGWYRVGPDQVRTFHQTETVRSHLDGELLTVEGHGTDQADGHVIHRAFAIVSIDHETGRYRWDAHVPGASTSTDLMIDDTGFSWLLTDEHGVTGTRFRIDVDEWTWHETGDLIEHGTPPARILEMTLQQGC